MVLQFGIIIRGIWQKGWLILSVISPLNLFVKHWRSWKESEEPSPWCWDGEDSCVKGLSRPSLFSDECSRLPASIKSVTQTHLSSPTAAFLGWRRYRLIMTLLSELSLRCGGCCWAAVRSRYLLLLFLLIIFLLLRLRAVCEAAGQRNEGKDPHTFTLTHRQNHIWHMHVILWSLHFPNKIWICVYKNILFYIKLNCTLGHTGAVWF